MMTKKIILAIFLSILIFNISCRAEDTEERNADASYILVRPGPLQNYMITEFTPKTAPWMTCVSLYSKALFCFPKDPKQIKKEPGDYFQQNEQRPQ